MLRRVRANLTGPGPSCSHLWALCFQDLGQGQVFSHLGLCLGVAALEKGPQVGLSATHPHGWGQPPLRGNCCFIVRHLTPEISPPISQYDHCSHIHGSHTPLSYTALSYTTLTHTTLTYCSHTPLSHTHCSHIHCSHTPLSHTALTDTPLSHTPLSHYDHCSHTMTNSTAVSRRNGMSLCL